MNCNMASMSDTNSHLLSDITDLYGLHQLINEPTRVTDTTSTLIDLIYTNYPDKVVCSGICHVSISDHSVIFAYRKLSIGVASKRHNTIKYSSFKNFNRDYFRSDIASQNWDALDNFQDPNDMWREWKIKFLNVVDTHAPLRTKRVRLKRSPWITSELKKRMHERDIMKLKAIRSKNPQDWGEFKQLRNKVNSDIRILKESYYKQSFTENKNDSRRTWQTINELTSRKSNTPSIKELIINGVSINKSTDLANAFNEHFSTVGPKLANQIPSAANGDKSCLEYLNITDQRFCFTPTNTSQVLLLLNKLSKSKATGLDYISARLIRECADLICISICKILNCSLTTGMFPDDWKCAKVIPLFKQGSSSDMNNYRPISIISAVAKVFERIIYDQIYAYLFEHDILSKSQSGFHSIHSMVTALLEATDSWAFDIDRGNVNAVVFLDLKKGL